MLKRIGRDAVLADEAKKRCCKAGGRLPNVIPDQESMEHLTHFGKATPPPLPELARREGVLQSLGMWVFHLGLRQRVREKQAKDEGWFLSNGQSFNRALFAEKQPDDYSVDERHGALKLTGDDPGVHDWHTPACSLFHSHKHSRISVYISAVVCQFAIHEK